jgi:AraC-like DNA-binding protein
LTGVGRSRLADMVEHFVYKPGPPLDRFVEVIWTSADEGRPHPKERLLPDGSMELVFDLLVDRFRIYDSETSGGYRTFRGGVICGPHSQFFAIDTAVESSAAGVHFKPGGAYPFFRLPSGEIHNAHIGVEDVWGARARDVREQLLASKTPRAKAHVLEQALLAQLTRVAEPHPAVAFALGEFRAKPDAQKISEVTSQLSLSPRQFIEVFRKEVGLAPKLFCRVRRFQRVLRMIAEGRAVEWAEIALSCGYFDQAHFIHDFRGFSGINPSTYLADHTSHFNHVPMK